jgi:hypothetical protein
MRLTPALALIALVACKREEPRVTAPPPAPRADASVPETRAPQADVDLLHAMETRLAVSSVVANPKISPFDLVDGDLATAWSSRTGQLVGAWIAFRVRASTRVTAVRLTVGFVSKGREGDHFTLNPRIKRVAIWHDGVRLREHELDVESRELQTVPVGANGGDYKLEVVAIQPGARKTWREIWISELQLIGRPPPGSKPWQGDPEISIGSLDAAPIPRPGIDLEPPASFASIDEFCIAFRKRPARPCPPWDKQCEQAPEPNTCGGPPHDPPALGMLPAGWRGRWFITKLGNSNWSLCNLALEARGRVYVLEEVGDSSCGRPKRLGPTPRDGQSRHEIRVSEELGGGSPELVLVMNAPGLDLGGVDHQDHRDFVERLVVCTATPGGAPSCGTATIGYLEFHAESSEDGYDQWHVQKWKLEWNLRGGALEIHTPSGKPDEHEQDVTVGHHRLRVTE